MKWCDMLGRIIPWLDRPERDDHDRILETIEEYQREADELAPLIERQTAYLVHKSEVNGFTRQLRAGFESARRTGE